MTSSRFTPLLYVLVALPCNLALTTLLYRRWLSTRYTIPGRIAFLAFCGLEQLFVTQY
eukprot:gene265-261_t